MTGRAAGDSRIGVTVRTPQLQCCVGLSAAARGGVGRTAGSAFAISVRSVQLAGPPPSLS